MHNKNIIKHANEINTVQDIYDFLLKRFQKTAINENGNFNTWIIDRDNNTCKEKVCRTGGDCMFYALFVVVS